MAKSNSASLSSRILAWAAMAIVVACIVLAFVLGLGWFTFVDIFFAFLMTFCHLLAVYMWKARTISRQLDTAALVCGVLMIVSLVVDCFLL